METPKMSQGRNFDGGFDDGRRESRDGTPYSDQSTRQAFIQPDLPHGADAFHPFAMTESPRDKKARLRSAYGSLSMRKTARMAAEVGIDDEEHDIDPDATRNSDGVPFDRSQLTQAQLMESEDKIDRAIGIHSFLFHSHFFHSEAIRFVYGSDIKGYHSEFKAARTRFADGIKLLKAQTLSYIRKHVNDIQQASNHRRLLSMKNLAEVQQFFEQIYTPSNYLACFQYTKDCFDIEHSEELGKFFCKCMYWQICAQMKVFMNNVGTTTQTEAREYLLQFYDSIPLHERFDNVSILDFKQQHDRSKGQLDLSYGQPHRAKDRHISLRQINIQDVLRIGAGTMDVAPEPGRHRCISTSFEKQYGPALLGGGWANDTGSGFTPTSNDGADGAGDDVDFSDVLKTRFLRIRPGLGRGPTSGGYFVRATGDAETPTRMPGTGTSRRAPTDPPTSRDNRPPGLLSTFRPQGPATLRQSSSVYAQDRTSSNSQQHYLRQPARRPRASATESRDGEEADQGQRGQRYTEHNKTSRLD